MQKLKTLDLFSGIGGFSVGLEKTGGFETVAFCEIDPFCQEVLQKLWPEVEIYEDVRTLDYKGTVDVICGGFPCQDLSLSGAQTGIQGERSGLYQYMLSLAGRHRPGWIIFENVAALLSGGDGLWFSRFLNDLARYGYDAQWHCISASAVGAIHHRDRVWVIAYPHEIGSAHAATIFNSVKRQIAGCRTPRSSLALLNKIQQIRFGADEPDQRKFDGLCYYAYRLGALGNAVHPKITEIIGNAILECF